MGHLEVSFGESGEGDFRPTRLVTWTESPSGQLTGVHLGHGDVPSASVFYGTLTGCQSDRLTGVLLGEVYVASAFRFLHLSCGTP